MAIILRLDKGSELTFAEVDGNFSSLFYSGSLNGTDLSFYTYNNVLSQSFDLSNIPGFGGVGVEYDGGTVVTAANIINFTGAGVTVTENGNTANVEITGGGGGGDTYTNLTPTPINFPSDADPNIPSNTTFQDKTFTEMMNMMLYPTLYPTLTNPSNGFSLSPSGYKEIGEVIGTITLSSTLNRGSINPDYGTNGFRSGLPNTYIYTGTGVTNQSSTSTSNSTTSTTYEVIPGAQSWTSAVAYDAGEQPLNSIGGNYDSPLAAGTTSAITKTITGVYPTFATTSTISTLTQQSLQSMTTYEQVSMVTEAGSADKQTIEIPDAWSTITGLQQFNTLSSTWDTILLSTFTGPTPITRTIQSNTVDYNRYIHNGPITGARQLRFLT